MEHLTLVGIVGPTAVGKTAVGIELAKTIDGEIISADSIAVYKGMGIGTAKPSLDERRGVPFHLIDVVYPDEPFSVAEFKRLADQAIRAILERGKTPILVGGTGLYIRAVVRGLKIPAVQRDEALRERLKTEAMECGPKHLHNRLREVDPITAARLHPNDLRRVIRALEVYLLTGKPISRFHEAGPTDVPYPISLSGLIMERAELYENIEMRVDRLIEQGLVAEVAGLLQKGYSPDLPAMKGLGYKQIAAHLLGVYDLDTAIRLLKRDTRRFAKRQMTWFRAESGIHWIEVSRRSPREIAGEILSQLRVYS